MADPTNAGPLASASSNRLACLFRHWTWADNAKSQFERELGEGWDYDCDPAADRLFGCYYHWCALLCGFSEAALDHALLIDPQLSVLRADIEAALPQLRACREVLVVIPASRETNPRIVDILRDNTTVARLRRLHDAFGDALRAEQSLRESDMLDMQA
jgi:hypothetical protein